MQRPCEPDDVVRCLDRLYRHRRIDLQHARILRIWGERQCAPDPRAPRERGDSRLWREAMQRLDWPLGPFEELEALGGDVLLAAADVLAAAERLITADPAALLCDAPGCRCGAAVHQRLAWLARTS